jgi:RNA polymerase sigma-70 factor, ECF subfamily
VNRRDGTCVHPCGSGRRTTLRRPTDAADASPAGSPDAALVARAARGDADAVARLYDVYAGPLYGFGFRRLGDRALAEELVQTVMTRLWQRADRYQPARGSVRTWVFAIARNVAVDLHRRRPRALAVAELPDAVDTVDELEDLVRAEAVRAALERLSDEHREVLRLAYDAGLTQRQIAERLGIPVGTVKSRTYYALKAFRLACQELGVTP